MKKLKKLLTVKTTKKHLCKTQLARSIPTEYSVNLSVTTFTKATAKQISLSSFIESSCLKFPIKITFLDVNKNIFVLKKNDHVLLTKSKNLFFTANNYNLFCLIKGENMLNLFKNTLESKNLLTSFKFYTKNLNFKL